MSDIIPKDDNRILVDDGEVEVLYGKVLELSENTPDLKGILNKICQYVDIATVIEKVNKGVEYVVQIPTEFQQGFDIGEYWIMENSKTDKSWPFLMQMGDDGKQHILSPLPLKKQSYIQGNPVKDITNNFHNLYMQQKINEISGLLETTLDTVKKIEHGQMDDRIGLLNAGKQQICLAFAQKAEDTRLQEIREGRKSITIAQQQFLETFKRRVNEFEALPKSKAMQFIKLLIKSTNYLNDKDNEYSEIQEYFSLYIQATNMLAYSYAICNDMDTASLIYDKSIQILDTIDFSKVKTIEYSHNDKEMEKIYEDTIGFLTTEKQLCLDNFKQYDCLSLFISGDKLLEVLNDETEKV